jgi:hypothetical protein
MLERAVVYHPLPGATLHPPNEYCILDANHHCMLDVNHRFIPDANHHCILDASHNCILDASHNCILDLNHHFILVSNRPRLFVDKIIGTHHDFVYGVPVDENTTNWSWVRDYREGLKLYKGCGRANNTRFSPWVSQCIVHNQTEGPCLT